MEHMCITDHHNMTLAVKVALNRHTTNQPSFPNKKKKQVNRGQNSVSLVHSTCCRSWEKTNTRIFLFLPEILYPVEDKHSSLP